MVLIHAIIIGQKREFLELKTLYKASTLGRHARSVLVVLEFLLTLLEGLTVFGR